MLMETSSPALRSRTGARVAIQPSSATDCCAAARALVAVRSGRAAAPSTCARVRARAAGLSHPAPAPRRPRPSRAHHPEPLAYDYRFVSVGAGAPDGGPRPGARAGSLCGRARPGSDHPASKPGLAHALPVPRPGGAVRPAQSVDDLARTAAPPAGLLGSGGGFKACGVALMGVPRPLARSGSERLRGHPGRARPLGQAAAGAGMLLGVGRRRPGGRGLLPRLQEPGRWETL